jgi:hypothetical protein
VHDNYDDNSQVESQEIDAASKQRDWNFKNVPILSQRSVTTSMSIFSMLYTRYDVLRLAEKELSTTSRPADCLEQRQPVHVGKLSFSPLSPLRPNLNTTGPRQVLPSANPVVVCRPSVKIGESQNRTIPPTRNI